jgi:hypothetical protein
MVTGADLGQMVDLYWKSQHVPHLLTAGSLVRVQQSEPPLTAAARGLPGASVISAAPTIIHCIRGRPLRPGQTSNLRPGGWLARPFRYSARPAGCAFRPGSARSDGQSRRIRRYRSAVVHPGPHPSLPRGDRSRPCARPLGRSRRMQRRKNWRSGSRRSCGRESIKRAASEASALRPELPSRSSPGGSSSALASEKTVVREGSRPRSTSETQFTEIPARSANCAMVRPTFFRRRRTATPNSTR